MNNLKILQDKVYSEAKKYLGSNFIDCAVGGSALYKKKPNDVDVILLLHKFDPIALREFYQGTDYHFSVLTESQFEDVASWSVKVATMLYKGVMFTHTKHSPPTLGELKQITKRGLIEEITNMERKMIERNLTAEKAFDLLRQKALLCLN